MRDSEYEQWWQLHLRVVRGESLTSKEQAIYHSGNLEQDQEDEEQIVSNFDSLRILQGQINSLTQKQTLLQAQSRKLDQEISKLEKLYLELTGHTLTATFNAAS